MDIRHRSGAVLRLAGLLAFLIYAAVPAFSEPVWSGNASVDAGEFVNFTQDFPLAGASSSFSRNTKILVTNPQNDQTVEVTIVKRAPRPGVFLVLSPAAAQAISMPEDQVIPVQVKVASSDEGSEYEEFNSADPDINPAVSVPDETAALADAGAEAAPAAEEPSSAAEPADGGDLFADELLSVPVPEDSLRVDREPETVAAESGADEEAPAEAETEEALPSGTGEDAVAALPPAEPASDDAALPESAGDAVDLSMESELRDELLPSGDNVIYFLTPSDFRPPTGPVTVERDDAEEIVPVLVDRNALEDYIVNNLNNGSSYIQLGAYSSADSIYGEIKAIDARYPMVVWTDYRGEASIFKLLIGPLTEDETGVLSYRFKDSGYADLFLYRP